MQSIEEYAARRMREAADARLTPLRTIDDSSAAHAARHIGSDWTRQLYDGPFHLVDPKDDSLPAVSLVFVQSREGNTGARDPDALGGGPVDKHLIYEGLSRVAADAVLAGAKTAAGDNTFFSVWHPDIVSLRAALGLPRHPAQVIVSRDGRLNVERTLLFNVPDVPVFVLSASAAVDRLRPLTRARPWISLVRLDGDDLRPALRELRTTRNIRRISAIGGRTVATSLLDADLVQDLCLTTSSTPGGEPGTPLYTGTNPPRFDTIVRKAGADPSITFEHLAVKT